MNNDKKNIIILGSTGSIGKQTLDVVSNNPEKFNVVGLSAYSDKKTLAKQAEKFHVSKNNIALANSVKGQEKINNMIYAKDTDLVVNAMSGAAGLQASYSTLKADKILALANKESLVVGGDILMKMACDCACKHNGQPRLLPIDSEHGAIFQCLIGEGCACGASLKSSFAQSIHNNSNNMNDVKNSNNSQNSNDLKNSVDFDAANQKQELEYSNNQCREISKLWVTASGGPFFGKTKEELMDVSSDDALAHPTWNMGPKITIDSSTLMNKGLEVIEAHHLFGLPYEKIKVVVQRQSVIHSMVEYIDGSVKAHLGTTDMRIPIQFALSYPDRLPSPVKPLDFTKLKCLDFGNPDRQTFKCLDLAYKAGKSGGVIPCIMNAANEVAVAAFLNNKCGFLDIANCVDFVMKKADNSTIVLQNNSEYKDNLQVSNYNECLKIIKNVDLWTRKETKNFLKS